MAKILKHRRAASGAIGAIKGEEGEFFMDTTTGTIHVMDGQTYGGHQLALFSDIPLDINQFTDADDLLLRDKPVEWADVIHVPTNLEGLYLKNEVQGMINVAITNTLGPVSDSLDTLDELAEAIGDDPQFITTINTRVDEVEAAANAANIATNVKFDAEANTINIRIDGVENDANTRLIALDNKVNTEVNNLETVKADKSYLHPIANTGSYNDLIQVPNWHPIALSGSYLDLNNKPNFATIALTGSYNNLLDLPPFKSVATSGSYSDLIDKPIANNALTANLDLNTSDILGTGNINITGDITVTGAITSTSDLSSNDITSNDISANNITATGDMSANGALRIDGGATVVGNITGNEIYAASNLTTSAEIFASGRITALGAATFGGNTAIGGTLSAGATTITGPTAITGSLSATGDGTIGGNASITGNATITGNITANGNINASTGDLTIIDITASGDLGVDNITASGDMSVGAITAFDITTVSTITGPTLNITADADVGGDLGVVGDTDVGGNLDVVGNITANNVTLDGNLTVNGTTTTVNTETINLADNIISINSNLAANTAPSQDGGLEVNRGSSANVSFLWDESNDNWTIGNKTLVTGSIIPAANVAYDLGTSEKAFKDLYLSGNTINLGGATISSNNGAISVPSINVTGSITTTQPSSINQIIPDANTDFEIVTAEEGEIRITSLEDDIRIRGKGFVSIIAGEDDLANVDVLSDMTIGAHTVDVNGYAWLMYPHLDLFGDTTFKDQANVHFETGTIVTVNTDITSTGDITANNFIGNVTGDIVGDIAGNVTGTVSSISNHDTDALAEGNTNLYYTDTRVRSVLSNDSIANTQYVDNAISTKDALSELSGTTDDITEGNTNVYYTDTRVRSVLSSDSIANTQYVDNAILTKDALSELSGTSDDITEGNTNLFFTSAEQTKLANIEANADVTDTVNVTAAGALMESEVTNLAQVKAFDSADYATAAQGTLADSALQDITGESVGDLSDVTITNATSGQVLKYNGNTWVNDSDTDTGISNLVEDTAPQLGFSLDTNGYNINFKDNNRAVFGGSGDLSIYHNGLNSFIEETGTGDLFIRAYDNLLLQSPDSGSGWQTMLKTNGLGTTASVDITYGGATKLSTTNTGIDVTGTVTADGLTLDGNLDTSNTTITGDLDASNSTITTLESQTQANELGRINSSDQWVPFVYTESISNTLQDAIPPTLNANNDIVKTVYSKSLDRYTSGGELLLTFINNTGTNKYYCTKRVLFSRDESAGANGVFNTTETSIGDAAELVDSIEIQERTVSSDLYLDVTVTSPNTAIAEAEFTRVVGEIKYTSVPIFLTASGY